jgi:protein disulfide-isomerase A6
MFKNDTDNATIPELKTQTNLQEFCLNPSGVCVIAFFVVEPDFPESLKNFNENLEILQKVKKSFFDLKAPFHFVWVNTMEHGKQLAKDFDLG